MLFFNDNREEKVIPTKPSLRDLLVENFKDGPYDTHTIEFL